MPCIFNALCLGCLSSWMLFVLHAFCLGGSPVSEAPNAQAEARATPESPTPAHRCPLWPVASSASLGPALGCGVAPSPPTPASPGHPTSQGRLGCLGLLSWLSWPVVLAVLACLGLSWPILPFVLPVLAVCLGLLSWPVLIRCRRPSR